MTTDSPEADLRDAPDVVGLYVRALAAFGEQLAKVGEIHWDLPTPCSDWDARALVAHVVIGEAAVPQLIRGESTDFADVNPSVLGPDAMATWRGTALAAIEIVRATPLDTLIDHPVSRRPLETVLGFRITDNLVHSWDLATAMAESLTLDPEIAQWALDFWLPLADKLTEGEFFAPMLAPSDDEPGTRLLALLGRSA